jgi:phosphocarrier protein FPr/phosphocarrier protein
MIVVRLSAPMAGWVSTLETVPDPVFAERMMGDGLAIDPLDEILRAPCDCEIIAVAPTGHSVTLRLANGAELLIHVGLETVKLDGAGFTALVENGASVREGDSLIRFDLDLIATRAESAITPIVVASEGYRVVPLAVDRAVSAGDPIMDVRGPETAADSAERPGGKSVSREAVVAMASGLHARPAARIAAALKPLAAEVRVSAHGREADARSPVALMALGLRHGDAVTIIATGSAAAKAAKAVAALIETAEAAVAKTAPAASPGQSEGPLFRGVRASPGLAVGEIFQFRPADAEVPEEGAGAAREEAALASALEGAAEELGGLKGQAGEIAAAHRALLADPELLRGARDWIARGKSAGFAWRAATRTHAEAIRATGNDLLIERIDDLLDVERQVIYGLLGEEAATAMPAMPRSAILVTDTLLPSQFLALDHGLIGGIVTAGGGATSHVAILAASAGIPMLIAAGRGVLGLAHGRKAILDADAGTLDGAPDAAALANAEDRVRAAHKLRRAEAEEAAALCVMADGTRIEIFVNLASAADAAHAVAMGAEGCGLLRTEFLFLDRDEPPSAQEQAGAYAEIAAALDGRPLIVRTLDVGADKPVPYLRLPAEDNPALGRRGVRLSRARPELLAAQLEAILAGVPAGQCRIMVPMVIDRDELRFVRTMLDEAAAKAGVSAPPLGVMIETPAAALLAASLAAEADFFSIGTNDLSQYGLAADRLNPDVASIVDALHPAILRLIAMAAEGAAGHGRMLGICGGIASDPKAAPILIGLGATELSGAAAAIPGLKARIRSLTMEGCRSLAARALAASTAAEVRALLEGEEE